MQRYCGDGTRDFWGAQAASLHVSAACRDYLLDALRLRRIVAGRQPALPKIATLRSRVLPKGQSAIPSASNTSKPDANRIY